MTNLFLDAHCCFYQVVFYKSKLEVELNLFMPININEDDKNKESINLHPENH